ncbi:hypothetical protein FMM05_02530 [Flavobacterium zepuense]|uniref:Uncharacterized protein n=1 Tax=Flavobacterium zepuense TaxID=2593302 RepID=A0A552VAN6_9FLAO|nr:hypothetical protein [Flavobacterium zepuense]TRW27535.1 hypothetical protein FMM05_02530 [Flavobacterium zepuense]
MIFEKYSYKTKFIALVLISLMLGYTAYKRSFSTLISLIKENKSLTSTINSLKNSSGNEDVLLDQINSIDKIIGKEGLSKERIQQDIINFVAKYNKGVSIYNMESIHEFKDDNNTVYTNILDITGSFNNLLEISYNFEKKFDSSRLISLNFYSTKKNNKPDALHLKMIFQNYENNK